MNLSPMEAFIASVLIAYAAIVVFYVFGDE